MRTLIVSPRQDLIELVADILGSRVEYSSCLVVFPGKRPAHFLRKVLARRSGVGLIPPRILSMDTLMDFLYEDILKLPGKKVETIDAVALLFEIHMQYAKRLGGSGFTHAASFLPLGHKLYRDLEELFIEGVTPDQVRMIDEAAGFPLPIQSQDRMASLSFFYEKFYDQTERMGLTTRSQRYRIAASATGEGSLSKFDTIVLAGFFGLTRAERDLFRKITSLKQSVAIFQDGPGIDSKLNELDLRGDGFEDLRNGTDGQCAVDVRFYQSPDSHGQIFGLNSVLAERGSEGEHNLIVLPSADTLFPLVHNCTALSDGAVYNISLGYPLIRTPVYGFLRSLAEVITTIDGDRVHIPAYLSFVLHPYTKNIYFKGRADVTRILFHGIEADLTSRQKSFSGLEEIEEADELFRELIVQIGDPAIDFHQFKDHVRSIHDRTIRQFLGCRDLEDFAGKIIELIQYIYEESTARLHPFFHPFSESLVTHLSVLKKSLLKEMRFQEMADYFNFLRRYAPSCHVPFEGTPLNGLQVLGLLETRNLKFDRVFILDANEDIMTGARKEDSLLPNSVRRSLGLPDYRYRTNLTAYYLDVLLKGARESHLFYIQNDRKERSRLVERLIWEKQKVQRKVDADIDVDTISYAIALENRMPVAIAKNEDMLSFLRGFPFSATSLDSYLGCPLSFYYRYVLGLSEKERVPEEMEGRELGKLVHACLHTYFEGRKGRRLTRDDIDTLEMQTVVNRIFSESYGQEVSGGLFLARSQICRHLSDFLIKYQLPCIEENDITVLSLEQQIHVEWGGYRLRGRVDRVERRNNETVIIDYKTGARSDRLRVRFDKLVGAEREKWPAIVGSLQLPFYLLAHSIHTGQSIEAVRPMFFLLGRSSINADIEEPLFVDGDDRTERMGHLEHVLRTLLSEIVSADTPFRPTTMPGRFCPWCDFQSLCGTRWVRK